MSLSAGDWVRLQRLRGARSYASDVSTNKDIINKTLPADLTSGPLPFPVTRDVGSSKIRREPSKWVDYKASQVADYVLTKTTPTCALSQSRTTLCDCTTSNTFIANKQGLCATGCTTAQHLRM
jgi:hypothetical protein